MAVGIKLEMSAEYVLVLFGSKNCWPQQKNKVFQTFFEPDDWQVWNYMGHKRQISFCE